MSWNPLQDLLLLQDRMNRLFEDATQRRDSPRGDEDPLERADWQPAADVYQSDAEMIIAIDLPGIDKASLETSVDNDKLTVRGKRDLDAAARGRRGERPHGTFVRIFNLPASVDQTEIHADYKDGVLQIHLPRKKSYGQRIEIKIS